MLMHGSKRGVPVRLSSSRKRARSSCGTSAIPSCARMSAASASLCMDGAVSGLCCCRLRGHLLPHGSTRSSAGTVKDLHILHAEAHSKQKQQPTCGGAAVELASDSCSEPSATEAAESSCWPCSEPSVAAAVEGATEAVGLPCWPSGSVSCSALAAASSADCARLCEAADSGPVGSESCSLSLRGSPEPAGADAGTTAAGAAELSAAGAESMSAAPLGSAMAFGGCLAQCLPPKPARRAASRELSSGVGMARRQLPTSCKAQRKHHVPAAEQPSAEVTVTCCGVSSVRVHSGQLSSCGGPVQLLLALFWCRALPLVPLLCALSPLLLPVLVRACSTQLLMRRR